MGYTREDYILAGVAMALFLFVLVIIGAIVEWEESKKTIKSALTLVLHTALAIPIMVIYYASQWWTRHSQKREYVPWQPCRPRRIEYGDCTEDFEQIAERRRSA